MALDNPSPLGAQILAELEIQNLVNYHTAVPDALFRSYLKDGYSISSINDMVEFTGNLSLPDKNITDMTGLEYAKNITGLSIGGNEIESIDLSEFSALTSVYMSIPELTNVGVISFNTNLKTVFSTNTSVSYFGDFTDLVALEQVYLNGNTLLTDIGTVTSTVLNYLRIDGCAFAQAELENIIDALHINRVAIGALSCVINMVGNVGSAAAAISKASEIADIELEGSSFTI